MQGIFILFPGVLEIKTPIATRQFLNKTVEKCWIRLQKNEVGLNHLEWQRQKDTKRSSEALLEGVYGYFCRWLSQ